jgi:hypothetical protein
MEQVFFHAPTFALPSHLGCRSAAAVLYELLMDSAQRTSWQSDACFLPNPQADCRRRVRAYVQLSYTSASSPYVAIAGLQPVPR